jgi:hypothetical protein
VWRFGPGETPRGDVRRPEIEHYMGKIGNGRTRLGFLVLKASMLL